MMVNRTCCGSCYRWSGHASVATRWTVHAKLERYSTVAQQKQSIVLLLSSILIQNYIIRPSTTNMASHQRITSLPSDPFSIEAKVDDTMCDDSRNLGTSIHA